MRTWWLSLLIPLLTACGEKLPQDKPAPALRLVKALKVGAGATAAADRYSGEVRARIETPLGFRVGGKIVERRVDVGARVRAGQPLARLDPADLRLAAAQAAASDALAAADLKRTQELKQKNFISQAALDARETAATAAAAQARLAKHQADYATLTADADGVIAAVLAEPGQVVSAGQAVVRLARDGAREVAVAIPESRLAGLKVGADATVALWSGKTYRGRLRELAPAADPATRTFAARVTIIDATPEVALGMTATVSFARPAVSRVTVPLAALLQDARDGSRAAVWVIGADGAVKQRDVAIERYGDAGAELKDGLVSGETIVAAGAYLLTAGEKVRIAAPAP